MNSLETAKKIIKDNYNNARHGLFDCRNIVGDKAENIYQDENIKIDICREWEYMEVFGLTKPDFIQLWIYYDSLGGNKNE